MAPIRKITLRQLELLLEFIKAHRDILIPNINNGARGNQAAHDFWESIAPQLNTVSGGARRSPEKWRRYWVELKAKLRAKAADRRRTGIGEGKKRLVPLSPLEKKALALIGSKPGHSMPWSGVRLPLNATIETSAKVQEKKRVSFKQYELLLDFINANQDVVLVRYNGGPLGDPAATKAWEAAALQLNAVQNGALKTPDQWRRLWIEFKAKIRSKAADLRRMVVGPGGRPPKLAPLSPLEKKALALIKTQAAKEQSRKKKSNDDSIEISYTTIQEAITATSGFLNVTCNINEVRLIQTEDMDIPEVVQEALIQSQASQPEEELDEIKKIKSEENVESQLTPDQHNRLSQHSSLTTRRLQPRKMRQDSLVPDLVYNLETRQLDIQEQHAMTLTRIAKVFEKFERFFNTRLNNCK